MAHDEPNADGTWPLAVLPLDGHSAVPCVGCGHCCLTGPCGLAYSVFAHESWAPSTWRCPALRQEGDRYRCGLVLDVEGAERRQRLTALYIGAGCCSSLNSRRRQIVRGR